MIDILLIFGRDFVAFMPFVKRQLKKHLAKHKRYTTTFARNT